ncbi:hypothetical protein [Amnibacterium kyonggiense]|uniref:GIY-YIG domain-containing protein n=1 Tax=Amnibacterium kyonggiense TaxID=595671 RepID=A0A4V3EAQ1_9MICO|nr:hypothetical protein [Amnibacterium kyonggiense]TDS77274.1 hypothetical protein CLV52_2217 [Amnibacterium kyonggiense]
MSDAQPWSRQALEEGGFRGFVPFAALRTADVPAAPGVYVVLRTAHGEPEFLAESAAGPRNGTAAAVSAEVLAKKWVPGPEVVYIGKATQRSGGKRGLQKRLDEYVVHGAGGAAKHWGGRYVWQLADRDDLLVAWNVTDEDPGVVESRMLGDFVDRYGVLPFANLRR